MTQEKAVPVVERAEELWQFILGRNWREPVPDDVQSEVRMMFNEAIAGGPNMNGDGGPTLTTSHALDCISATIRIEQQAANIAERAEMAHHLQDARTTLVKMAHTIYGSNDFTLPRSAFDSIIRNLDWLRAALAKVRP